MSQFCICITSASTAGRNAIVVDLIVVVDVHVFLLIILSGCLTFHHVCYHTDVFSIFIPLIVKC